MDRNNITFNTLLLVLWLAAAAPVLEWAWQTLAHDQHRMSLVLLVMLFGVFANKVREISWRKYLSISPRLTPLSVVLVIMGGATYLLGENSLDIDILSSLGFALMVAGLLRCYLQKPVWSQAMVPLALLIGVLPFQFHLEAYVGFPLRAYTAMGVGTLLGVETDAMSTVLAMENQVAAIDLPCSGLKSLWVGILFFLAAKMSTRSRPDWRWIALLLAGITCLVVANFGRVMILSHLVLRFGPQPWIDIIHVPLGIVAFVCVCGLYFVVLRRLEDKEHKAVVVDFRSPCVRSFGFLFAVPLLVASLHQPFAKQYEYPRVLALPSLEAFTKGKIELTTAEKDLFSRFDAVQVGKYAFDVSSVSGSLLVSRSRHWRAHHNPEQCFRGSGLRVKTTLPFLVDRKPVRGVMGEDQKLIGLYWFQTSERFTDDFSERIYASLWEGEQDWLLVSMLFSEPIPMDQGLQDFVEHTRATLSGWMSTTGS